MGMKAKVALLAVLIATVAGAIAFDKFRAKSAATTNDGVEPTKTDTPAAPSVAATPRGSGLTPVREIVAAPRPAPPRPMPPPPKPPEKKPVPPTSQLPTDVAQGDPIRPMETYKPQPPDASETAKDPSRPSEATPKTSTEEPRGSGVEIANGPERTKTALPDGLHASEVVRPPDTASKPTTPETPVAPPFAPPMPAQPPDTYVIEPGDSLCLISQKVYGTSRHWRAILEANHDQVPTEDTMLVVGKSLRIPKVAAPAPRVAEGAPHGDTPQPMPAELAGKRTHTVRPGDNLSTISKLYYRESRFWQKIAEANGKFLKDPHDLQVGMVLVIPDLPAAPPAAATPTAPAPEAAGKRVHVVAEGDILSTISQKHFGTTRHWKAIFDANRSVLASPDDLTVGMKLVLPELAPVQGTTPAPTGGTPTTPSVPSPIAAMGTPYTVQEGDTLTSIAEKFLGSQNEWGKIYDLNKGVTMKDPDHLSPGMVIVIPKHEESHAPAAEPSRPTAPPRPPTPRAEGHRAHPPVANSVPPNEEPKKTPALTKVPPTPPAAKKDPAPAGDSKSSTGSKLGIE